MSRENRHDPIEPYGWAAPKGYSNGILAAPGRLLFVAGQIAWSEQQEIVSDDFTAQFDRALANVLAVVHAGGGRPEDICRFTIYVTDKKQYLAAAKELGGIYRQHMGRHYPAMALVQVAALVEDRALIEIEATAVVPSQRY